MNIWQIDPVNLTPYYNTSLCQALALEGHQVRYVTSKFLYDSNIAYSNLYTVDIHYFRILENKALLRFPHVRKILRALLYPFAHWRLFSELKQRRPDIVHFQWSRLPLFDRWLVAKIHDLGIPVVHTVHDVVPSFSQGRFTGQLKDVYAHVDAFIVHTEDSHRRFLHSFPDIDQTSVYIVPLVTTEDHYVPLHASQQLARQHLGISDDAFIILFFGTIKHYKGVDVLARALPIVHDNDPDLQLWLIGRPETGRDLQLLDELRKVKNVHTYSDYVPSDAVWQYHLAADVIVFPYRSIFQSAALNTAMGYGRPVIVTDVGGMPESIDGNGWIVPAEDPAALAHAILEAAGNRAQLNKMGERSREIVHRLHGPVHVAAQHSSIYARLLDV